MADALHKNAETVGSISKDLVLNTFECIYMFNSHKIVDNKLVRCEWNDPDKIYGYSYIDDKGNAVIL